MIRPRKPARPSRRFRLRPAVDRLEGRSLMATAGVLDPTFGGGRGQCYCPSPTQNNFIQGLEELQQGARSSRTARSSPPEGPW